MTLLHPFVVTAWHGAEATMPGDVKEIFSASELARDPKRSNLFVFLLDERGRLVHAFHGLPGRRGDGRSDYAEEIKKGLAKLKLPADQQAPKVTARPVVLPDLPGTGSRVPAGVRLVAHSERDGVRSRTPLIEVVPMKAEEWNILSFPEQAREIEAAALRSWLVQLYPAAIRTVDQQKPFQKITGSLKLEPAGTDRSGRYALLRGDIHLVKGDDTESAFEGTLQAVVTYRSDAPEVLSVRVVIEGDYLYRMRGTQRIPMQAAIESRPAGDP